MFRTTPKEAKIYYPFSGIEVEGVIWVFSSRSSGNMSLFYGDTDDALENRSVFMKRLGIDSRDLVSAKQVHGSNVRYAREEDRGCGALSYDTSIAGTDAFVTDIKGLPLAVFTADCLSVFIYDKSTPAVGLVHAGWRSTKEGISAKAIELMRRQFNTDVRNLYVSFGPAIRSCCYEVGEEVKSSFSFGLTEVNRRYYLDIAGINRKQILGAGIDETHIYDTGICTFCHNRDFFSYRKEGKESGRMISVIMLK